MKDALVVIIDRLNDWFVFEDTKLNPYYCSILLLDKLSSRPQKGIVYNRVELIFNILNQNSEPALDALDAAIVLLSSRNLIQIREGSGLTGTIFITQSGRDLLAEYKKELKK